MPPEDETPVPKSFDDWLYDPPALQTDALLPPWAWWVIGGIGAILLIVALLKLRRRLLIPPLPREPNAEAFSSLAGLMRRAETLPPAEMATGLVSSLNRYLHRRYGELAEFRTRDELFDPSARPEGSPPLPPGVSQRFSSLMAHCEELRFAGIKSTAKSRRKTVEATVKALEGEPA